MMRFSAVGVALDSEDHPHKSYIQSVHSYKFKNKTMADPGFLRRRERGRQPWVSGKGLFLARFAENFMKMDEIRPRGGGARPWHPSWIRH